MFTFLCVRSTIISTVTSDHRCVASVARMQYDDFIVERSTLCGKVKPNVWYCCAGRVFCHVMCSFELLHQCNISTRLITVETLHFTLV